MSRRLWGPSGPSPVPTPGNPVISCPAPLTVQSPTESPVNVVFGDATATNGSPPVKITCDPANNTQFPLGDTTVTCTATDAIQRSSSCTFVVTVRPPARLLVMRFAAFGDSITLGEDGNSLRFAPLATRAALLAEPFLFPAAQTYPGALQLSLSARYTLQSPVVDNQGRRSESLTETTAPTAAERLSFLLSTGRYDVVLLMEGTNDLSNKDDQIEPRMIAVLQQMLRDAKSRGVRPYLATLPPENPAGFRGGGAALVPGFNDRVRGLAAAENVPLVDVYQALNTDVATYIGFDGLHPTAAGYVKIAETFLAAIQKTLEAPSPAPATSRPTLD